MDGRTPLHLIVLAGGSGSRAADAPGQPPKQFRDTGRGPLLTVAVAAFAASVQPHYRLAGVTVAVAEAWVERAEAALSALTLDCPRQLAPAGATRTGSTWEAVRLLADADPVLRPADDHLVAVHDAARPFASADLLDRLAAAAAEHGGAVPGVPVPDTIVQTDPGGDAAYLEREFLQAVQTPQVFRWGPFLAAHRWAHDQGLAFTDDGGLLAVRGLPPRLVPGEAANWKVTHADDWLRAAALLGG